jgi:hypothetical protein
MKLPNRKQRRNLRAVCGYLLSGDLRARFDMEMYSETWEQGFGEEDCGSVGCFIGHGPYAGVKKRKGESWNDYCGRAFGAKEGPVYDHLFGEEWMDYDNTPEGTTKRVLKFVSAVENRKVTKKYLRKNTPFLD